MIRRFPNYLKMPPDVIAEIRTNEANGRYGKDGNFNIRKLLEDLDSLIGDDITKA